jgi:endonuclease/exonuclease/phosphatase family metal-dependent hydrolase
MLRIGTWNLERRIPGRSNLDDYDVVLKGLGADVVVITEPGAHFVDQYPSAVVAPPKRGDVSGNESWVAILVPEGARTDIDDVPYERLAASAVFEWEGRSLAVYGSVLPWNAALSQAHDVYGEDDRLFDDVFGKALREQSDDVQQLQAQYGVDNVIWAGDFNHPLEGPLNGFSTFARTAIQSELDKLGLVATNRDAPHRIEGVMAIDLICVPATWNIGAVEDWPPTSAHGAISDHRAYVVSVL